MKLRFSTGLIIAFALLAQPSAACPDAPEEASVSRLPARSSTLEGELRPEWISLRGARSGDGTEDLRSLPPLTSRMVDDWLQTPARGHSRPCIGVLARIYDPPRSLGRFPENFGEFVAIAKTIVVGTVREREPGFLRGVPATAFWIETEEVLAGAPGKESGGSPSGFGFAVPLGSFEFAGYKFCSHDVRLDPLPEIGDRLLLVASETLRPAEGRDLPELWPGDPAFVIEREGAPSLLFSGVARTDKAFESADSLDAIIERLRVGGLPGSERQHGRGRLRHGP